jgi:hypothetical protein
MTFENYWPLILTLVPYLWWVLRHTAVDLRPKHLRLSTAFRSGIIICWFCSDGTRDRSSQKVSVAYLSTFHAKVALGKFGRPRMDSKDRQPGRPDRPSSLLSDHYDSIRKTGRANRNRSGGIDQARPICPMRSIWRFEFEPNHLSGLFCYRMATTIPAIPPRRSPN